MSTSVLLERLKDFEVANLSFQNDRTGERPQTATVLSKIGKSTNSNHDTAAENEGRRIGGVQGGFGTGGLGSGFDGGAVSKEA